jgi:Uncharacterized conserved protein (DUF2163)
VSYDALEQQGSGALPYELYLFTGTGVTFAFTSSETPITYLGQVYSPATITRTETEISNEVVSGQLKIYLPNDNPMAELMVPYLPASPIAVTVFGSHFGDSETVVLFSGTISSAACTDQCELICNSAQYLLQRKIPQQLYQAPCSHIFGDGATSPTGCNAILADHTYSGVVSAIDSTGTIITVPAFASLPDPLEAGYLKFGNSLRMILAQSGDVITLLSPIAGLEASSAVSAVAGCNLDFTSCAHYGRTIDFLGFDLIPTVNPFDGSASIG